MTGVGCWGDRVEVDGCLVPRAVLDHHPDYLTLDEVARDRARIQEDFEFWCVRCDHQGQSPEPQYPVCAQ